MEGMNSGILGLREDVSHSCNLKLRVIELLLAMIKRSRPSLVGPACFIGRSSVWSLVWPVNVY